MADDKEQGATESSQIDWGSEAHGQSWPECCACASGEP